ncbi:MAG TPA: DUF3293 domain-containing protein [Permianibacter sp.]|nr:DUF3293 domain-containing protein [Permianibacter sp.]
MKLAPSLLAAYQSSHYRVHLPSGDCELQIGARSATLDACLRQQNCQHACFITAHNPRSHQLPATLNRSRNAALVQVLLARRLPFFAGVGYSADPDADWPAETSFLVLHTPVSLAHALAVSCGQNAVLIVQAERPVTLLLTAITDAPQTKSSRQ